MHIPDGFLDTKTVVATSLFSLIGITRALRNIRRQLSPRKVPLMGLAAAFIFVAQMINFPVVGGTSGHLVGAVLVSVLLGPGAGILVMTVVLLVQCFLFADGGVLALGANIFNMGIIATIGGYYLYRAIALFLPSERGKFVAITFAAWASTVLAAVCCTGELAWSGTVPWSLGLPAMAGIHMLIGAGEGLITALVLAAIYKTRPELLSFHRLADNNREELPGTEVMVYGVLIILGILLFILPFASRWPDGLEKVAASLGFISKQIHEPVVQSPIANYQVPGIGSSTIATGLAGIIGAVVVFIFSFVLARTIFPKSADSTSSS